MATKNWNELLEKYAACQAAADSTGGCRHRRSDTFLPLADLRISESELLRADCHDMAVYIVIFAENK